MSGARMLRRHKSKSRKVKKMRYIEIPEGSINLVDDAGRVVDSRSFKQWVERALLRDPAFGKTAADLLMADDIKTKLEEAGWLLELSDAEWTKLKTVAEAPAAGYNVVSALQTVSYLRLVLHASTVKPQEKPSLEAAS